MGEVIKFVCVHCEKEYTDDYKNIIDGKFVCDYCLAELYAKCDDCGDYILKNDLLETRSRNFICQSCYEENYFTCNCCNNIYPTDDSHSADDELFCENCFYDNYSYCHSCNTPVHRDNVYYHESSGNDYCSECYPGDDDDDEGNYSKLDYCPKERTYTELPFKDYKYGIECETATKDFDYFESTFCLTHDGSIDGFEFISDILDSDAGLQAIREFCDSANKAGCTVDSKCGLHLHISNPKITPTKLRNLLLVYKYFEDVIYSMLPSSRLNGSWARPVSFSVDDISKCKTERDIQLLYYGFNQDIPKKEIKRQCKNKYLSQRYHGLNIHSFFYRSTVELRYHSSTLNSAKIIFWIKLNLVLFSYAINHNIKTITKLFTHTNKQKTLFLLIQQSILREQDKKELVNHICERINKFAPKPIPETMPIPEEVIPEEITEPVLITA